MASPTKPAPRDPAIEARNLVRRFGPVHAVSDISFEIARGEFFSLLGPSGCGKTTLLRLIAGLDAPDSGELKIAGRDARGFPAHQRPVNTVFQSYALFPHLSVWDNIAFGLRMAKVPPGELQKRVRRVMELVEVTDLQQRRPSQLSGGQKQRVALARAIVNEPGVLLLDEPLGALDLKLRKQLQLDLHRLQQQLGMTFVYVTHDQEEALVMSDRIAVMNSGRIEQLDTGQKLYERPRTRFVAQFIGSCNLVESTMVRVATSAGSLALAGRPFLELDSALGLLRAPLPESGTAPEAGRRVTVAFRPEKVLLQTAGCGEEHCNAFDAVVEESVYSGAESTHHLRAVTPEKAALEWRIKAVSLNARSGHQALAAGDRVRCLVDVDAIALLED